MAHKVIVPPKKNCIPQFLKQRDINSYYHLNINLLRESAERNTGNQSDRIYAKELVPNCC
jgi:hypothetical protein